MAPLNLHNFQETSRESKFTREIHKSADENETTNNENEDKCKFNND